MRQHKRLLQAFLSDQAKDYRKQNGLSQEAMSELLHIAARSYCELEHNRSCFSGVTLMVFLSMMDEERLLEFHRDLCVLIKRGDESYEGL